MGHRRELDHSVQQREVVGFSDFYRREYRAVVKLAYVMCGRWAIAEEVTQEAFLRAMDRWDGEIQHPQAWVRTVAVNLARSRLRRLSSEMRALARLDRRGDGNEPDLVPVELRAFWVAVRCLPRRQGQAVALYYLEDRPVREVAELMGCAEGTAKALLHQARGRLSELLDVEAEEPT